MNCMLMALYRKTTRTHFSRQTEGRAGRPGPKYSGALTFDGSGALEFLVNDCNISETRNIISALGEDLGHLTGQKEREIINFQALLCCKSHMTEMLEPHAALP